MPSETATAGFTQGSLFRHISVMSVTSSIGLMAIFAVDLIDVLFISMLGHRELAAAAGYASTLLFFVSALNIGMSIAASALVAQATGEGNAQMGRDYATNVALISLALAVLVPVLALPNLHHLLGFLGATGEVADLATAYLRIILPMTFLSSISMISVATLRSHGDARHAMYPALIGAAVTGICDPILIFWAGWGLEGAAAATVLGRIATMCVAVYFAVVQFDAFARPDLGSLRRDTRRVAGIAVPAVLATVANPVGVAIITREMGQYGAEAVAGMAIINRLNPVVFSIVLALSGAIGPIFAQNFGAGLMHRVQRTFVEGLRFVAIYVVIVAALLFAFRDLIGDLFNAKGMVRTLLYYYCGPLALAVFFNGTIYVATASFNNLGRPRYATLVNWSLNTVAIWTLTNLCGDIWGAPGVLIGQALSYLVLAMVAIWLSIGVLKRPGTETLHRQLLCPNQQRVETLINRSARS